MLPANEEAAKVTDVKTPEEAHGAPAAAVPEATEAGGAAPAQARAPFDLQVGAEVEYGPRRGRVTAVRGNGSRPYEVRVRWDDSRYPEWYLHAALKQEHERGALRLVRQGKASWLARICPFC